MLTESAAGALTDSYSPWFTSYASFLTALKTVYADDGGDTPETPFDALGYLTDDKTMLWSSNAYKFAVLITDAPYKNDNRHGITDMEDMISRLSSREIYTSVITDYGEFETYGDLATQTGGILADLYDDFSDVLGDYAESIYSTATTIAENYSVKVTDAATGLPVQNASIAFQGGGGTTQNNGVAVLSSRTHQVTDFMISKAGYQTYRSDSVTLKKDGTVLFQLEGTPDTDGDGTPLFQRDMLMNPPSSSDKIAAPSVEIFGKEFSLLNLPTSLKLTLFDKANVSIKHDKDNKKFSAIIGADVHELKEGRYWEDYSLYKNIVQTFSSKTAQQIKTDFTRLKGQFKNPSKLLFPVTTNVAGYIDVSYSSGNLELAEGGVVVAAKMDTPFGISYPLPPAPYVFIKVEVKVDASLKVAFVKVVDSGKVAFSPSGTLSLAPSVTGTLNLGVDKVAYVGGGIQGKLESSLKIPSKLSETLKIILKGSWVWTIKLGPLKFNGDKSWGSGIQIFPPKLGRGSEDRALSHISKEDFSLIPRPAAQNRARTAAPPEFIRYDTNIYESSAPQLVELDNGNLLLVWTGDDPDRSLANASALYYSIYDGSNWSTAALVDDNQTADFNPFLYKAADGTVHLVWQDCRTSFRESDITLDKFAGSTDISYISFTKTGEIGKKQPITGDSPDAIYRTGAQVSARNGSVSILWLENSENDLLLTEGQNSIHRVRIENGTVLEKEILADSLGNVTNFASDYIEDDQNIVAYTTRDYNDLEETFVDNPYIYLAGDTDDCTEIATYDASDGSYDEETPSSINGLQFSNGNLYWSDPEGIKMVSDLQWSYPGIYEVTPFAAPAFKVLKNENSSAIVMQSEGITNEIYASYNDGGTWTAPTALAAYEKSLSIPSGILRSDGKICLTFNQTALKDNDSSFEGSVTDLIVAEYERKGPELEISPEACIPTSEIAPDAATYLSVFAKNNGASSTPYLKARVTLDSSTVQETEVYTLPESGHSGDDMTAVYNIGAGEQAELLIPVRLPASLGASHTATVEIVDGSGATDTLGTSNKTASCAFSSAPDLEVSNVELVRSTSGARVSATIKNVGSALAENIVADLFDEKGFSSESSINSKNLDPLPVNGQQTVEFTVDESLLDADSEYDYKRFIVRAVTDTREYFLTNNSDSALLAPIPVSGIELEKSEITVQAGETEKIVYAILPDNAGDKNVTWHSSNLSVARVDEEGTLTGFQEGTATITAISTAATDISQSMTVHVIGTISSPEGITIDQKDPSVKKGETTVLTASITPSDALNKEVTWYSDDPDIATVETEGLQATITGIAAGTANIYVVTKDGGHTDHVQLTVVDDASSATFYLDKNVLSLKKGQTERLTLIYDPEDIPDDGTIFWDSSDPYVAAVVNGAVTARNPGTAIITAKIGSMETTCTVTVQAAEHTVAFNGNGGRIGRAKKAPSIKNITVQNGNTAALPGAGSMTRKGYTFEGWFTAKKGGSKITGRRTPSITKNVTYYAHWKKVNSPGQIKKLRLDNPKAGQLRVRCKKTAAVQGYRITYATNRKFTKNKRTVLVGKGAALNRTIKKLKKGTTYWVKVQAYRKDSIGARKYGKNSSVKKLKLSK